MTKISHWLTQISLTDIAGKEHTIELNAYESSTSAVENSLDEGGYTVTSIEYKGINQDIISGGFGLSKQMNLQISDTPEIPFYTVRFVYCERWETGKNSF